MSFNGSGTFVIDSTGQPVQSGTTISDSVFNALTADLATGLSTCVTKDGQTTPTANLPMGGYKFTGIGLGSATTDSARMDNATTQFVMEGRLGSDTPTSNGNLTFTDATTFIYLNVFRGNKIALYNGTQWVLRSIAAAGGTNIAVPATTDTNYDVFAYDNAGTVTLELTAWASATARTTGIVYQDGVLCKSGTLTRRYLGTIRTGAVSGQVRDAATHRFIWNYYNRIPIAMSKSIASTTNWAYTTATFRQANGDTANQIEFVTGVAETPVHIEVNVSVRNSTAQIIAQTGIGIRSTTTDSATVATVHVPQVANIQTIGGCKYFGIPAIGHCYAVWLEKSNVTGTATWNDIGTGSISGWFLG